MRLPKGNAISKQSLQKLLREPTDNARIQLLRYGGVSIVAFVFDFGLLFIFTSGLHIFYLLSTTLAFFLSIIVNYVLTTRWVFQKRVGRQKRVEVALFVAICTVALLLNDLFMWIFVSGIHIQYLLAKLLTVAIVFFWSFGARRVIFSASVLDSAFVQRVLRIRPSNTIEDE